VSPRAYLTDRAGAELPGAYAYELIAHCGRWGVPASALLEGTDLTLEWLKDPATRLPLAECGALIERARALTRQPALAFSMGLHMRLSWHGFLGFAAMTAATVREALEVAEQFSLTRTSAFTLSTHVEGGAASLVVEERAPLGGVREFLVIALLVGLGRIASDVTARAVTGVAECAFPEPAYAAQALGSADGRRLGTMRFGQPSHRVVFDASILDMPLVTADPAAAELLRAQCDRELAALAEAGGFVGRVRSTIASATGRFLSLADVARAMRVSTRTLKRRLAEQGTSFSEVLDGVRCQRALLLLDDRRIGLGDVADRLGYSDVANFTRAFRRWTGRTPAAFRGRG
jgi:AraC-like DNA-binding protein